jgi:hypothetical protein
MRVLLVSTYDLGRQPFGLASPAAWLRAVGIEVICSDLTQAPLDADQVRAADLIAFHLPMHTATRMAVPVIERIRHVNPKARLCCYGVYAPPNADLLRSLGVEAILGGEFEADLVRLAAKGSPSAGLVPPDDGRHPAPLPRLQFVVPDRTGLPALTQYASLRLPGGEHRTTGYTEASRGCKHVCRHCPIVPIYGGQFRVVPRDVVLADIAAQIEAGARHITFGDPDFFNGIRHAREVVTALGERFPGVTYDVTIKIQHLLDHREMLPVLRETGCLFVTSAVESIDDRVLTLLEKRHTYADFVRAVRLCQEADLVLSPTFVAFHPWIGRTGYIELLDAIRSLDLVEHVAPIQLAIRLLIPEGSRLLELESVRGLVDAYDSLTLAYPWRHADPAVDALQHQVMAIVRRQSGASRSEIFEHVYATATAEPCGMAPRRNTHAPSRQAIPYLTEPWYCCAEPL